jgi:hypothetical protein
MTRLSNRRLAAIYEALAVGRETDFADVRKADGPVRSDYEGALAWVNEEYARRERTAVKVAAKRARKAAA